MFQGRFIKPTLCEIVKMVLRLARREKACYTGEVIFIH